MNTILQAAYDTASRDELKSLITCFAECLNEHLILHGTEEPLLIIVNGSEDAGKTLFWDVIRTSLLPHALLDPYNSSKTDDPLIGVNRDYETWEGYHDAMQSMTRIFCANALDINARIAACLTDKPSRNKELGDVLIINNTISAPFIRTTQLLPDAIFSLCATDPDLTLWQRRTHLEVPEDSRLRTLQPLKHAQAFCLQ